MKGKIPHKRLNIHSSVKGFIVAQVSFVRVLLFCDGKFNCLYTKTCFAKYDFFVDYFVVTNRANYQNDSAIFNQGRHCISSSYTRIYLKDAFGS